VLMHGSNGAYLHWLRNIEALTRLRTVLTPDLPGFGDSLDIAPDISLEGYVDLQTRAINEMCGEAEPIDIVGFSFGGQIAAGCAVQLGNRVQTLSLLTPSGFEKPTGRVIGVPRRETFPPTPGGQHNFHRKVLLKVMFAKDLDVVIDHSLDRDKDFHSAGTSQASGDPRSYTAARYIHFCMQ
jgi:pimeloyl-ACP methyl ester carboxylesterase